MLVALEHCTIRTTRLAETRRFFEDILGLKAGPRPPLKMAGFWLYIGGTPVIHQCCARDPGVEAGEG